MDGDHGASTTRSRGPAAMLRLLGALVACLVVAIFAVQNDRAVHLRFLGLHPPAVSLPVLLFAALLLGALAMLALGGPEVMRLRRRLRELTATPPPTPQAADPLTDVPEVPPHTPPEA